MLERQTGGLIAYSLIDPHITENYKRLTMFIELF